MSGNQWLGMNPCNKLITNAAVNWLWSNSMGYDRLAKIRLKKRKAPFPGLLSYDYDN
jgi:hypothetical protein